MLFEDKERAAQDPKGYAENDFEYLDRSGRVEAERIRQFLNEWISKFPKEEAEELVSRITSSDPKAFKSATFEIVLFALITNMGASLEIHPVLENGSKKRPDFLVSFPNGNQFYLEAVLASEFNEQELAAEKRKNIVLDKIDEIESPDFILGIDASGNPMSPPSGKKLCRDLKKWLASLDVEGVDAELERRGLDRVPVMPWAHDGWKIKFEAFPKRPEKRGEKGKKVIGMQSGDVRWANSWEPIRDAVKHKGSRYGVPNKPFVIAVNAEVPTLGHVDHMQALFGQEQYVFDRNNPERGPKFSRAPNGALVDPSGQPQYTRVSGVWIFSDLSPWNLGVRSGTLYFNPWAEHQLSEDLRQVNYAQADSDGRMSWHDKATLAEILELETGWPSSDQ